MSFYTNLQRACSASDVSVTRMLRNIRLSSSNATYWKNGNEPNVDTVKKIADYLNIPVTQLVNENKNTSSDISEEVINIARRIDNLPADCKKTILDNLKQYESFVNQKKIK